MPDAMPTNLLSILVVYGDVPAGSTVERAGLALVEKLRSHGFEVVTARSAADGEAAIHADPLIGSLLVGADVEAPGGAEKVLRAFRARNDRAPTFLLGARGSMGLRDLSDAMFAHYRSSNQLQHLQHAFSSLPTPVMVPADAYRRLVRNEVERVPLDEAANRVVATSVVPYPPGIPMLMPGENLGAADGPYLGYLRALRDWDRKFAGFGHETHGVEVRDGGQFLYCVKTQ